MKLTYITLIVIISILILIHCITKAIEILFSACTLNSNYMSKPDIICAAIGMSIIAIPCIIISILLSPFKLIKTIFNKIAEP